MHWLFLLGSLLFQAPAPVVRIGVLIDGPWERNDRVEAQFREEILELARGEFDVTFPDDGHIVGDWTVARVDEGLDRLLADPEIDLVLAMGIVASDRVVRRSDLPKPVIAPFVLDAEIQATPLAEGASGVTNLSYLASSFTLVRNLEAFSELRPFSTLALLHGSVLSEIPAVSDRVKLVTSELGVETTLIKVGARAEDALAVIPDGTEAVYVMPLLELDPGELERLAEGLIARKLPSFAVLGRADVERGLLMSIAEDVFDRRSRRVALNVQRALLGEDPGTFAVDFVQREEPVINMATARAIDVFPSFAVETVTELVDNDRPEAGTKLSLLAAAERVEIHNRDLAAFDRAVAAGAESIRIASSSLLPSVDVSARGAIIDSDRSEASGLPERTLTPAVTLRQLVYSDAAWANKAIQTELQRGLEAEREILRLDVVQAATTAYLDVMRALTSERVRRENLSVTRSNLELARVRVSIGSSTAADVYRWESQMSSDQSGVIRAAAQRNRAEIALNRVLHRELEAPFTTEEMGVDDPVFLHVRESFYPYISSRRYFDVTRDALAGIAREQAPEVLALESAIGAQERALLSADRSFYLPDIFFQASVEHPFRGGAGAGGLGDLIGALFPQFEVPPLSSTNWTFGFDASFPLFTSGRRPAVRRQESELLSQLRFERESVLERIEERLRSSLHQAGASYADIRLARDAADSADNNLALVSDAYAIGAVSILELLDAQNASVVAEEGSANATYDFLIDMLEVERALGRFYFQASPAQIEALFDRIDGVFEERGVRPPPRSR